MTDEYEVGYGKPPENSRFRKGRSGNPKGRPKGTKNIHTDLEEELQEKILIREGSRTIRMSKQRVIIKGIVNNAMKSNIRAFEQIVKVKSQGPDSQQLLEEEELREEDKEILKNFEEKIRSQQRKMSDKKRKKRQLKKKVSKKASSRRKEKYP